MLKEGHSGDHNSKIPLKSSKEYCKWTDEALTKEEADNILAKKVTGPAMGMFRGFT